ncbi:MAG: chromosomal replication initiator protein DnaA [Bacillota bacterium]|nr:chromosomal replication initiator protein DnaA [Bacillota bacterium]
MESAGGLWERAVSHIRSELTEISYNTWIKPIKPISLNSGRLILEVPTDFVKNTLENRYRDLINDALRAYAPNCEADFTTTYETDLRNKNEDGIQEHEQFPHALNPKYSFENFVVGENNKFAHAASLAVAEFPGRSYNPLFIYGGTGLGKTHLMHAIGNYILFQNPQLKVMYVTAERFTNEMITAISTNKNAEFRARYRSVDVLLVDDIHFLAEKGRIQEEFFHTFNALHGEEKQLVLSSDKQPDEIPSIEERLRSRFEWGLIVDVQPPDFETRVAILWKKAQTDGLDVDNDVMHFIAMRVESNIRKLEGSLLRVKQYGVLMGRRITLDMAKEAMKDLYPEQKQKQVTPHDIREAVCNVFNIKHEDLISQRRSRDIVFPRQVAMYLLRETGMSLPKIGSFFGGRDHTTVMHACEKIGQDIKVNSEVKTIIEDIRKKIND